MTKNVKTNKKPKLYIAKAERRAAAKYFTMSNMALTDFIRDAKGDLNYAYQMADQTMQMECGTSITEEFKDWLETINGGDVYCYTQWEAVKSTFKF
jgi:hypothetical protein